MPPNAELAHRFVGSLRAGKAPWRFPHNRLPEFLPLFGRHYGGEPRDDGDYAEVEALVQAVGVPVRHHWNCRKPRYLRDQDRILLPLKTYFQGDAHYEATRLHEVVHAVEGRTGWTGPSHQGELIAEVGATLILSRLRLAHDTDDSNINKWLPSWAVEIAFSPAYLFDALVQAGRAADYLLDMGRWRVAA